LVIYQEKIRWTLPGHGSTFYIPAAGGVCIYQVLRYFN